MNNDLDSIARELAFAASVERVWKAISDPQEIRQWFGSDAHFELIEGAIGYFEWQQECEGKFAMQIETIDAPNYLAWRWMQIQDAAFDKSKSTLVEWTLKETADGGSLLIMVESGFAEAKQRQDNIQGWQQELADLERYLVP